MPARSVSRRAALKTGVALGAVCALGVLPADGGAEASGVEVRPAAAGDGVARRLRLSRHGVLRAQGGPDVVYGELGGLTVAVAGASGDEFVVGVEGGVDAPRVYAVSAAGARTPLPGTTAELHASLARARAEHRRRRGLLGPGRAEATHDVARCAALLAGAAAMLVLCARPGLGVQRRLRVQHGRDQRLRLKEGPVLHPLLAGALGLALAAAVLVLTGGPVWWLAMGLVGVLVAVQARRRVDPAEAAYTRRWLLPPTLGGYLGCAVYFVVRSTELAVAAALALTAAVWLAVYVRERLTA